MSEIGNDLRDRLSDRMWVDRWAFLLFSFGGAVAIFAAKASNFPAVTVAGAAMLVMVGYAALVQLSGTGKLRSDQAGDNCYYLGLIYTLVSLAYAIFTFDPADTTSSTIVSGFGIALATTIMGLVLRVFFNQTRVDLVQTEDSARLELAEFAGRLKSELAGIIVSMNDFGRATKQSIDELRESTMKSMTDAQKAAIAGIQATVDKANEAMSEQAQESNARAKRLSAATDRVVRAIEQHASSVEAAQSTMSNLTASLGEIQKAAEAIKEAIAPMATTANELRATQSQLLEGNLKLSTAVGELVEGVAALDGLIGRVDDLIAERLAEVRSISDDIAKETTRQLQTTIEEFRKRAQELLSTHDTMAKEMSASVDATVRTLKEHNGTLAKELAQSSANVGKVHAALVEMTGKLADRLER